MGEHAASSLHLPEKICQGSLVDVLVAYDGRFGRQVFHEPGDFGQSIKNDRHAFAFRRERVGGVFNPRAVAAEKIEVCALAGVVRVHAVLRDDEWTVPRIIRVEVEDFAIEIIIGKGHSTIEKFCAGFMGRHSTLGERSEVPNFKFQNPNSTQRRKDAKARRKPSESCLIRYHLQSKASGPAGSSSEKRADGA